LNTISASNIDSSLVAWATTFCEDNKESMDYFLKHGNLLEKVLVLKVIEIARGKHDH